MNSDNPILNNPYEEPLLHYDTDRDGNLDYSNVCKGRRIFKPDIAVIPSRQSGQKEVFEWNDDAAEYEMHMINLCRKEVGKWRLEKYPNTTRVSRELLQFWFSNPDRHAMQKLFFAQQESVETAIWLNEVADKSNAGQNILNKLRSGQMSVGNESENQLPRIAFKMATGTGKTVVMACFILYHYFNRQEYINDTRFADYFLIVAPGITIKDRLITEWYNTKVILLNITNPDYKRLLYFENPKKIVDHIARGINPQYNSIEHIRPVFNYYNKFNSSKYVNGNTVKDVYPTVKSHVNYVVMDSDWEAIAAKTLEELDVVSYVKNQFLGFAIPYVKDGKDKQYFPDFIARVQNKDGKPVNLIIEISGMSKDKAEKKWFVENRWLHSVNSLKDKYNYPEWHFIEIANDIRNIKNQLIEKISSMYSNGGNKL